MSKSIKKFSRWISHDRSTWSFQIFQRYNDELHQILNTHIASTAFTYKTLKDQGARITDHPSKYLNPKGSDLERYKNLKEWSDSFNLFDNWVSLSRVLSISSTIETYLASVIDTALHSDPGLLLGFSRSMDGAVVLKNRQRQGFDPTKQIESCTKGTWSSRLDAFERLFGQCPADFRQAHSSLEELREIRNRFGHALGRDIDAAREHGVLKIIPMERLSREKANKLWKTAYLAIKAVDQFLLKAHIGDFEAVRFYHFLYPDLHKHVSKGQRAVYLKTAIGKIGATSRGKLYCNELVAYWEAL
jgi:hypothetical protein